MLLWGGPFWAAAASQAALEGWDRYLRLAIHVRTAKTYARSFRQSVN
jgi:hypothetical protein